MEVVDFRGHPLITATHRTTLELTKDWHLTRRGDCIIGVGASKACIDLNPQLKKLLMMADAEVRIRIIVQDLFFELTAKGHPSLSLSHVRDMVVRRSGYTCPRTLAVFADKAAVDMPRRMVNLLKNSGTKGRMVIEIRPHA